MASILSPGLHVVVAVVAAAAAVLVVAAAAAAVQLLLPLAHPLPPAALSSASGHSLSS